MYWDVAAQRSAPTALRDLVSLLIFDLKLIVPVSWTPGLAFNWPRNLLSVCAEAEPGDRFNKQGQAEQGAVAQLGERLICIQEVVGSIPISSTSTLGL